MPLWALTFSRGVQAASSCRPNIRATGHKGQHRADVPSSLFEMAPKLCIAIHKRSPLKSLSVRTASSENFPNFSKNPAFQELHLENSRAVSAVQKGVGVMVQFVCDTCGKVKGADNNWILAMLSDSGEVDILSGWPEEPALNMQAVHFCSEPCKDRYMATAFVRSVLHRNLAYRELLGHPFSRT